MRPPDLVSDPIPTPESLRAELGPTVQWSAWLLAAPEKPQRPEQAGCLVQWLVHCPGAHPHWSCWLISAAHLRDIPGATPATKLYPEAEHEVIFRAVNSEKIGQYGRPDTDDVEAIGALGYLTPLDLVVQLDGINDATCTKMLNAAVEKMLRMVISPDTANRAYWASMFAKTLLHYKQGIHKEVLPS